MILGVLEFARKLGWILGGCQLMEGHWASIEASWKRFGELSENNWTDQEFLQDAWK